MVHEMGLGQPVVYASESHLACWAVSRHHVLPRGCQEVAPVLEHADPWLKLSMGTKMSERLGACWLLLV